MEIKLPRRTIKVFTVSPRTTDGANYFSRIEATARWSEQCGCTGVLLYTGNDTIVDPWLMAQAVVERTQRLHPLVAVNPVYMHPFSAAKMIVSITSNYNRKLYVNLVAGTSARDLASLNDHLQHDDRYDRLTEYALILRMLTSTSRAVTFNGKYFSVHNLRLATALPQELQPDFIVAGHSPAARQLCSAVGAELIQMLDLDFRNGADAGTGYHFGVVVREDRTSAWRATEALFPEDHDGRAVLDHSLKNTDAIWKHRLYSIAEDRPGHSDANYWLKPFRSYQADCPYVVGSYDDAAQVIARLVQRGATTLIVDVPPAANEFAEVATAFQYASQLLRQYSNSDPTLA